MSLPPTAKGARRRDPEPSEPHGPGPQAKTCSSSCLSWLHPLRSWSLRQTRGGSYSSYCTTNCPTPTQTYLDPLEAEYRELLELRERVRNAEATASGMQPRFDMADRTYDE